MTQDHTNARIMVSLSQRQEISHHTEICRFLINNSVKIKLLQVLWHAVADCNVVIFRHAVCSFHS